MYGIFGGGFLIDTSGVVVLVEGIALRRGDGGKKPQLVIRIGLGLLSGIVRREDIARAVIGVAGDMAFRVRDSLQPALRRVGVFDGVAKGVGNFCALTVPGPKIIKLALRVPKCRWRALHGEPFTSFFNPLVPPILNSLFFVRIIIKSKLKTTTYTYLLRSMPFLVICFFSQPIKPTNWAYMSHFIPPCIL